MATEAEIIAKWDARWNAWGDKAVPIIKANRDECERSHPKGGKPLMACIAKKNSETVTKSALGI